MASSPLPRRQYAAIPRPAPGVMTPEQWAGAVSTQRMDRVLPEHLGSAWGGLEIRPKNVRFATQNKGEKVYILLRQHWVTNVGWVFNTILYLLLPVVLYVVLDLVKFDLMNYISTRIVIAVLALYYSLIYTYAFRHLVDWYFNLNIVTNERVLDYQFKTFSSRRISETDLEKIEDVKETSIGFLPSFFGYGNVDIYTAADKNVITFNSVPQPTFVRDKIDDLADIIMTTGNES